MRRIWLVLALTACPGRAPSAPVVARTPAAPAPDAAVAPAHSPVRWSNIETVENCFYFSGPFNGRDENLRGEAKVEVTGTAMKLQLAAAVFEGTLTGEEVALRRTITREHEGTWQVTETVVGTYRDGVLRAQYRYEECGSQGCPGRCTMTADLVAR